jgi:transcriptional repressor NrdR
MNCPYCNCNETKVIDSRESKDGTNIKRRRECLHCEKRFSTLEKVLKLDLDVRKSNGQVEVFNLQKIKKSLLKACEKRPVTLEQIEDLIEKILVDIKKVKDTVIPTAIVGKMVLKNLKELDEIAFLKYAIVHNNYESMKEFIEEIDKLKSFDGVIINNEIEKPDMKNE